MAISPEQARDQKRFEQPPLGLLSSSRRRDEGVSKKARLAEFRAEVVVEQTQVLSAALEDAWIKSFSSYRSAKTGGCFSGGRDCRAPSL